ncbi:hypothetical protein N7451_012763 [Penicillium sp. IBT 35674x]|nr:hypothetical protein N7451_012763 [Penicillium sp. IBT 35674x]
MGTDKPTDLASSGTKQPSEIKRRQIMTLEVLPNYNNRPHVNAKEAPTPSLQSPTTLNDQLRMQTMIPPPHSMTTPSRSMGSYVTAATLRANSVPWHVSPTQPAILSCITNIRAGLQGLHVHQVSRCDEISDIHCLFCLGDDEDHAHESVVLRCTECRALSHLACMEEWLAKRDSGFEISCCACRNEGALHALIRPHRAPTDTARSANDATAGTSFSAEVADTRVTNILSRSSPSNAERRRSARLAGQSYQSRGSHVSESLRRSRRSREIYRN